MCPGWQTNRRVSNFRSSPSPKINIDGRGWTLIPEVKSNFDTSEYRRSLIRSEISSPMVPLSSGLNLGYLYGLQRIFMGGEVDLNTSTPH